jgi:hypothetical protein
MMEWLLPHLPKELILAAYAAAPGNEIDSQKLSSPESSAALAANTFGYFLDRPAEFPLASISDLNDGQVPLVVDLERECRFPWAGGMHPWLDAVVETDDRLIGIESKRFEPFRAPKVGTFSETYRRPVWGEHMKPFEVARDLVMLGSYRPLHLDCAQLIKHAFGIITQARKLGKRGMLIYLFAEPATWPDGRPIAEEQVRRHRSEVGEFADRVRDAEVGFAAVRYRELFDAMVVSPHLGVREHVGALAAGFSI